MYISAQAPTLVGRQTAMFWSSTVDLHKRSVRNKSEPEPIQRNPTQAETELQSLQEKIMVDAVERSGQVQ